MKEEEEKEAPTFSFWPWSALGLKLFDSEMCKLQGILVLKLDFGH